jgi:sugar/nucleoside kinase (ribokinase family)
MSPTILAIGDVTVDQILGPMPDLPRWGEEIEVAAMERRLGGNIGNFAAAGALLGLDVRCAGPVGADEDGRWLRSELSRLGIDATYLADAPGRRTSLTTALVRDDGERLFITFPGALADLEAFVASAILPQAEVALFSGWCQPPRVAPAVLLDRIGKLRREGATVMLDLAWCEPSWRRRDEVLEALGALDVVLMNQDEARALTDADGPEEAVARLRARVGRRVGFVIKRGAAGAYGVSATDVVGRARSAAIAGPIAAVGAGDGFNAGFIAGLFSRGLSFEASLQLGCDVAGHILRHGRDRALGEACAPPAS